MNQDTRQQAILLYDRFTHEGMDRRAFMAEMTRIAGSAAAATALVASIAASPAAAQIVAAGDPRIQARDVEWEVSPGRQMKAYGAAPVGALPTTPMVIVVHENRGLNDHIRDVARRVAVAGYAAMAPDFLTPLGGTPADEDQARELIGKLDLAASTSDAVAMVKWLAGSDATARKVGIVGFCWGGAMANRVALGAGASLAAAVPFYGTAPDPALAPQVVAPLQIHLAGLDERVNNSAEPWAAALKIAGKTVDLRTYPGVNHAFHNDTSAERYDKAAADQAWAATLAFFNQHLGPPTSPTVG